MIVDALGRQGRPARLPGLRGRAARLPPGRDDRAGARGRAVLLRPGLRLRAGRRHRTGRRSSISDTLATAQGRAESTADGLGVGTTADGAPGTTRSWSLVGRRGRGSSDDRGAAAGRPRPLDATRRGGDGRGHRRRRSGRAGPRGARRAGSDAGPFADVAPAAADAAVRGPSGRRSRPVRRPGQPAARRVDVDDGCRRPATLPAVAGADRLRHRHGRDPRRWPSTSPSRRRGGDGRRPAGTSRRIDAMARILVTEESPTAASTASGPPATRSTSSSGLERRRAARRRPGRPRAHHPLGHHGDRRGARPRGPTWSWSAGPASASTTSTSPPPPPAASWSSTPRSPTCCRRPSTRWRCCWPRPATSPRPTPR